MRTEDHPLEYLDFEGNIPAGEYGGGDVIVWDQGYWETEQGLDDPVAAVAHGELKFVLHGERLKGRFVIVRTHKEDQVKEDWLLIHKRDEFADETWDIESMPTSIRTGRTNEEVMVGKPATFDTPAPRSLDEIDLSAATQAPLPTFIKPMLATAIDRPFDDPDWLYEMKLDGYRIQAVVNAGSVKLWTRNRKDASTYFPGFAAMDPEWISAFDAVVDGEMVALDADGRPSFSLLQNLSGMRGLGARRGERTPRGQAAEGSAAEEPQGTLVYHAFDLLYRDGFDLTDVPLDDRKKLLRYALREHPSVRYVTHVVEHGRHFQTAVVEQRLEGSVAKLRAGPYEAGRRSRAWLKVKARREQELVLVGYERGQGTHTRLGSVLVATYEQEGWRFAGHVGSGMDEPTRKLIGQLLDEHTLKVSPIVGMPEMPDAIWSEPRHVIRAAFTEWTLDGLLRQASYLGREMGRDPKSVSRESVEAVSEARDKGVTEATGQVRGKARREADARAERKRRVAQKLPRPDTVVLERESSDARVPAQAVSAAELAALDELGKEGDWDVGGHVVHLTNLDKALFPEPGITKRDLVRYYTTIGPVILPYLRERPLNVHRWPDGVAGKTSFWQKQIPAHAPDWVARWDYPDAGRSQSHTYVVADRVATMAWLANQAVIDLHPWTSRLPDYLQPTYAYIDIDPGEQTTWPQVVALARLYRTALAHLDVRGYPKVTGQRGIQIWIPVEPGYTFEFTRDWVGELSRSVGAVVPDLVSWQWGKADRDGKARLDYTQNALNKTLVAPYAVRPRRFASVSVPITWDELDDSILKPDRWDIFSVIARVREVGDPFVEILGDAQELPPLS